MATLKNDGQENPDNNIFFEITYYQQSIIKNETKFCRNQLTQKLFEYRSDIKQKEFFNACEEARQSFCAFRTRFLFKDKLMQIIDHYDALYETFFYFDIEKEN